MRDIQIFGELLVRVRGEPNSDIGVLSELGLTVGGDRPVKILPIFNHRDVNTDDFGPKVPVELLTRLTEVRVTMTLVHYDEAILEACMAESQGGGVNGVLVPCGTPMGGGVPVLVADNHYITLNLVNTSSPGGLDPLANFPWRFFTTVLTGSPVVWPLGTGKSEVDLTWRVIPYAFPIVSSQHSLVVVTRTDQLFDYFEGGFFDEDQYRAYAATLATTGSVLVPAGPLEATPGEILSDGALLWDRDLQD